MHINSFLKLVEIQTKVASIIPFLLGTFYTLYRFNTFNLKNFLLMLISLLCIDMATTAINNYQDYKKAIIKHGYGYESHNAIVRDKLSEKSVKIVVFILLSIATVFGFLLYLNTNIIVLLLGGLSFIIGILYSYGPIPISRTPFGEVFSGGFMGFFIPFIAVYIQVFDQGIITLGISEGVINIGFNLLELLYIVLISLPAVIGIGNIMLANNICDIDDDIQNNRYTLPIYIGKEKALKVFEISYYIGYLALLILIAWGVAPLICIITFGTYLILNRHIKLFYENQSKKETFVLAVKNFVIINTVLVISLALGVII
ncbi:MAG: 1,4-dihydroxy-2-naphthoate polyprenyltransferase [Lutispora sp.]|nr:1,4-dihydroxy-2-naphthoate polyprenyltransferase [Lutispora sp.]MDD4835252.1 1,4-dihydroxy-2-naphthoate polyprenyltransferase [Lutispora sp.]